MNEYSENLLTTISSLTSEQDLYAFFSDLLSESEMSDIAVRWAILNEIKKNTSQRKIADRYQVSLAKVNKYGKILQKNNGFIKEMLDKKYDERSL